MGPHAILVAQDVQRLHQTRPILSDLPAAQVHGVTRVWFHEHAILPGTGQGHRNRHRSAQRRNEFADPFMLLCTLPRRVRNQRPGGRHVRDSLAEVGPHMGCAGDGAIGSWTTTEHQPGVQGNVCVARH